MEFSLRSIEKESKYSGSVGNTTLTSTGYLPHGTYSVYYRMCGRKIMLNKSLNVSGDTNLEFTLPTTKITGTIYDVNNKKYENSVDVCMYQIILVTEHIRSREFQMDSMYWLFQDRKMVNTSRQHQERSQFPVEMQPWM